MHIWCADVAKYVEVRGSHVYGDHVAKYDVDERIPKRGIAWKPTGEEIAIAGDEGTITVIKIQAT